MPSIESDLLKTALDSSCGAQGQQMIFRLLLSELTSLRTAVDSIKTEVSDIQINVSSIQTSVENTEKLWGEMRNVREQVQQHEQTIFGAKGDNGINGDVKGIKVDMDKFNGFKIKAIAYATAISTVLIVAKDYFFAKL